MKQNTKDTVTDWDRVNREVNLACYNQTSNHYVSIEALEEVIAFANALDEEDAKAIFANDGLELVSNG